MYLFLQVLDVSNWVIAFALPCSAFPLTRTFPQVPSASTAVVGKAV